MKTDNLDIVYTIKAGASSDELKYSLRSLKNMPHNRVWVYGGCPNYVDKKKVNYVDAPQNCGSKWGNTSQLLKSIVENENITENFIWFNDDFFVLKKIDELPYYYDRTLTARVFDFSRLGWGAVNNRYCRRLKACSRELSWIKKDTKNFELHIPIIFNRFLLSKLMSTYQGIGAKRSLYGNFFVNDAIERQDVKIYDNDKVPDKTWDFVSTSDLSFREGEVGKYIRNKFRGKSVYEHS